MMPHEFKRLEEKVDSLLLNQGRIAAAIELRNAIETQYENREMRRYNTQQLQHIVHLIINETQKYLDK